MRSAGKTKRELAVEAAIIGIIAAQVRCEASSNVVTDQEGDELEAIGRRLEEMAESMYAQSQPGARPAEGVNLDTGSLEGHWRASPDCSANRNTNNPTQSKYDTVDREVGLRLVDHEDRDA